MRGRLCSILFCLAVLWAIIESLPANFRALQKWTPAMVTFAALLATYLCLPTNCGVPKFNLSQDLLSPAPLDPQRLYLSIYTPPETAYGYPTNRHSMGQIVRPGSTSMWARVHFINGYSPVRAAGVARAFNSYVHGEIDPDVANYLLGSQAGRDGELAKLGVDGIIVANEMQLVPKPESEWELVHSNEEGRVYHRRDGIFARVRSVPSLDSRPNEQFADAALKLVENSRNRVLAEVEVPSGGHSALLTFSRPFFRGYRAELNGTNLSVDSYRGLMPTVEIPAGTNGRLVLSIALAGWYGAGDSRFSALHFSSLQAFSRFAIQVGAIDRNRPRGGSVNRPYLNKHRACSAYRFSASRCIRSPPRCLFRHVPARSSAGSRRHLLPFVLRRRRQKTRRRLAAISKSRLHFPASDVARKSSGLGRARRLYRYA